MSEVERAPGVTYTMKKSIDVTHGGVALNFSEDGILRISAYEGGRRITLSRGEANSLAVLVNEIMEELKL